MTVKRSPLLKPRRIALALKFLSNMVTEALPNTKEPIKTEAEH